jgi:hypothetical protein
MPLFILVVWAILVETFAHPLSTSVIRIRGGRVRRRRVMNPTAKAVGL